MPTTVVVPSVILMTDTHRGDPLRATEALPPGAAVLIRHYDDPRRDQVAATLAALARRRRVLVMVAVRDPVGDLRLAHKIGADGLHVPEGVLHSGRLTALWAWRRAKAGRFITAASHSLSAILRAGRVGVDAVLLSPVFPTLSHPGAPTLGALRVRDWVRRSPVPVLALGGVSLASVRHLAASGIWGGAAIGGLVPDRGNGPQ